MLNYGIKRFFKTVSLVCLAFIIIFAISILAYDKSHHDFKKVYQINPVKKESLKVFNTQTKVEFKKTHPQIKPNKVQTGKTTKTLKVNIKPIFSDLYLTDPISLYHEKELETLLSSNNFKHTMVDRWIKKALPEVTPKISEMLYVRIIKLRQDILKKHSQLAAAN